MSSNFTLALTALSALASAVASTPAHAQIAIQFGQGSSGFTAFSGNAAAPYTGQWLQNPASFTDLSTGATLTTSMSFGPDYNTTLTYNAPHTTSPIDGQSTDALMQSYVASVDNNPPYNTNITYTLSGFTSGSVYNVYVYANGNLNSNAAGTFTINGGPTQTTNNTGNPEILTAGNEYTEFLGVAPDSSGNITLVGTNYNVAINGVQLQKIAAAPEPSGFMALSIGLFGLGALAIKARRRSDLA